MMYKFNESTYQIVDLLRNVFESQKPGLYPNLKPHKTADDVQIKQINLPDCACSESFLSRESSLCIQI